MQTLLANTFMYTCNKPFIIRFSLRNIRNHDDISNQLNMLILKCFSLRLSLTVYWLQHDGVNKLINIFYLSTQTYYIQYIHEWNSLEVVRLYTDDCLEFSWWNPAGNQGFLLIACFLIKKIIIKILFYIRHSLYKNLRVSSDIIGKV